MGIYGKHEECIKHNVKSTLASIVFPTLMIQSTAWEFTFSDDPGCLFTHGGQTGTGNQACQNIDPGDDSDHVQIEVLDGCIITFFEEADCPEDGGDGELDVFDEGLSNDPLCPAVTAC